MTELRPASSGSQKKTLLRTPRYLTTSRSSSLQCFSATCPFFAMQAGEDFVSQTLARIQYSENPVAAATTSDLVVEAIVENMVIKKELFAKLDQSAPR